MLNYLTTPARALLLALALVAAHAADARALSASAAAVSAAPTARTRDEEPADRDGPPVGGVLIVVGIVAGVILLAWICSRVGDNPRGNLMM